MTATMFDCAYLPDEVPGGFDAAAFYFGGDALHVWPKADVDRVAHLHRLPIWVRSNPVDRAQGVQDGHNALAALHALGVPAHHGIAVALDLETATCPDYVDGFNSVMEWAGFGTMPYGSLDSIFGNPVCAGYWTADPNGVPHITDHPHVPATQYLWNKQEPGGKVNESRVHWWFLEHRLWKP
jgi:hypothetical protein